MIASVWAGHVHGALNTLSWAWQNLLGILSGSSAGSVQGGVGRGASRTSSFVLECSKGFLECRSIIKLCTTIAGSRQVEWIISRSAIWLEMWLVERLGCLVWSKMAADGAWVKWRGVGEVWRPCLRGIRILACNLYSTSGSDDTRIFMGGIITAKK